MFFLERGGFMKQQLERIVIGILALHTVNILAQPTTRTTPTISGFAPNPVAGFTTGPVTGHTPAPVAGLTPNPIGPLATNFTSLTPIGGAETNAVNTLSTTPQFLSVPRVGTAPVTNTNTVTPLF
jgi:hypothetical protein